MKKLYIVLLSILSLSLYADDLVVVKSVFSPKEFYVGDMVTVLIHVETPFEGVIDSPIAITSGEWIDIKSINVVERGPEVTIIRLAFTPFAPGLRIIPDIRLGDHVLSEYKIQTLSILGDQFTSLQPLAPQMVPPGTELFVVFILVALIFGPIILFLLIRAVFRSIKLAIKKYKREKPFRNYYKILKQLRSEIEDSSVRQFYVVITEHLRIYLSKRFSKEFYSATTMEMGQLLRVIMDDDSTEELLSICRFADLVKFSHTNASTLHREKDLRTIAEILHQLEGKERYSARF